MRLLLLLFPLALCAQFRAQVIGVDHTQAVIRVTGWTGTCTMDVRENNASGAQHPDWPSIADSTHPLTTVNAKNEKFLVVGQRTGNKALVAQQAYYYSISGCGGTATGTFATEATVLGAISHKQPAGDPNAWNALDYPAVDLTPSGRNKWYVHPITGIKHRIVTQPEDFSWMDNANQTFIHPSGGNGWSNFTTIVGGATSTAQTANTNPAFLYAPATGTPWVGTSKTMENTGVVLWAQCVTGTAADCDIELMLFDVPGVLPKAGTNIITVRAGGTFIQQTGTHPTTGDAASTISAAVASGTAAYPGGTGTNGFPRPGFQGWGNFTLTMDSYVRNATSTAQLSGTDLTIAQATVTNNFPRTMKPGQHIYIAGAGANCLANGGTDICTVGTVTDSGAITIVETGLTNGSKTMRPLPWGIAVRKKTATGQVRIGAMYRSSGHFAMTTGTIKARCHPLTKTRTDGVVGRLCFIPHGGSYNYLYFISEDGEEVVPLDGMQQLGGDIPAMDFDPSDAESIYFWHPATGLYKMKHIGDFGVTNTVWERDPPGGARYAIKGGTDYPDTTWSDPYFTITLVLSTASITSQINTLYPSQVAPPYDPWASPSFLGITGGLAGFYRLVNAQDHGPCQGAIFNIANAQLIDFINTGHDPGSPHNFSACHSLQFNPSIPNTLLHSYNVSGGKSVPSTSELLAGNHRINIQAIQRGGVMHTNTCLEWPMGAAANCVGLGGSLPHYDKACPTVGPGAGQIPQAYKDVGADGSNCVTMRISGSTAAKAICSESGNDTTGSQHDVTIFGACEWNGGATWSGGPELEVGMKFIDTSGSSLAIPPTLAFPVGCNSGSRGDCENFRVLTIAPTGDGTTLTIVVQRNASREHCCGASGTADPPDRLAACKGDNGQMQHANNWFGQMVPGTYGSCNSMVIYTTYPDPTTKVGKYYTEIPRNLAEGHAAIGRTSPVSYRYINGGAQGQTRNLATLAEAATQPPPAGLMLNTRFQGLDSPIGGAYQQYLSQSQIDVSDLTNKYWTGDVNFIAGGNGSEQNAFAGGVIGVRPTFVRVSDSATFPSMWRVTVAGGGGAASGLSTLKVKPVVAWCGPKGLTDISSPVQGPQIDAAPEYSYCVAYVNGECRNGSTAGQAWVKCPHAYKHPTTSADLHSGLEFSGDPCLLSTPVNAGYLRRFRTDIPDETGNNQMLVSDFFKPAGTQYAFWDAPATPGGGHVLGSSAGHFGLVRQIAWLAKAPKLPLEIGSRPAGLKPIAIKIGPRTGMTHARIKFGNNQNFECNPHYKTACYTDSLVTPYAFNVTDTLTPNTCGAGGCTLTMNVFADEVLWYQIETSTNGTTFTADPVQVIVP